MPARIVVVHDDPTFRDPLVASLQASGYDVVSFVDTSAAWDALQAAQRIGILVTRINFGAGKPHGVALAHAARMRKRAMRVLIMGRLEYEEDAAPTGLFLLISSSVPQVVETVERMFADDQLGAVHSRR
jgi:DNA-binding NtrC family response regulator